MALVDIARLQDWSQELLRRCGDFGSPSSVVAYEVRAYPNVDNDVYTNYAIISLAMSCNNAEYEVIIDFFSRSEWFTTESLVVGVGEDMRVMLALFGLTATQDVVVRNYLVRLSPKAVDAVKVAGDGNEIDRRHLWNQDVSRSRNARHYPFCRSGRAVGWELLDKDLGI